MLGSCFPEVGKDLNRLGSAIIVHDHAAHEHRGVCHWLRGEEVVILELDGSRKRSGRRLVPVLLESFVNICSVDGRRPLTCFACLITAGRSWTMKFNLGYFS